MQSTNIYENNNINFLVQTSGNHSYSWPDTDMTELLLYDFINTIFLLNHIMTLYTYTKNIYVFSTHAKTF